MDPQPVNVLLGDKIRHWSRVRVHHQFFPHHIDSPQLFAAPKSMTISDDWKLKRGWFRGGGGVPQTNQWVLPTEGLIRACLVLGKNRFPAEYELGVANLLRALDVQGKQGEFNEGIGYAMFSVSSRV